MSARRDGLSGLVRLRSVRERDSRIGLATALTEEHQLETELADLEGQLATMPSPTTYDITAFHERQHVLETIRTTIGARRAQLESARLVTIAARERWVYDRSRLKAVESLVERRAAARRAERARRERIALDEVAEEMWRRGQQAAATSATPAALGGVA